MVILRNLATGEQRVLDVLRKRLSDVTAGQLSGNFAVWTRCNPRPRCRIIRYDLASASATALPAPTGKVLHTPSVNDSGTVFYTRSNRGGCGRSVQLVKQRVDGPPEILASLPTGRDITATYALQIVAKPPGDLVTTRIYYDVVRCRGLKWDIYSVDTTDRIPLPP